MGGTNFWGSAKDDNIFLPPSFDDGILEVSETITTKKLVKIQSVVAGPSEVGGGLRGAMAPAQNFCLGIEKGTSSTKIQSITVGLPRLLVNSVI